MASYPIGPRESVTCIVDIPLTFDRGSSTPYPLCLAYKIETYDLVLGGVNVTDLGYVLAVKGRENTNYPMPSGDELAGYQAKGLIPSPMPSYSLAWHQVLFGDMFWLVLATVLTVTIVKKWREA